MTLHELCPAVDAGARCSHPRGSLGGTGRRLHRFSWINEWKELADARGTPLGLELILPDWFYAGVPGAGLVAVVEPELLQR